jgi:sugar-specific transcriptional regulator TrmB
MSRVPTDYVDELKTLCNLGLTLQQAKVYLALAKIGQASVKETSAAANIDRGECYRVVRQLAEKRLISKVLTFPIKYEAILFNAGIQDLLTKKKNEVSSLENNIEKLFKKLKTKDKPAIEDTKKSIRFLPLNPTVVENMNRDLASVVKSFDGIMDVEWFEATQNLFHEGIISALRRGVKYRTVISDPKGTFDIRRISKYTKETGFDLRITTRTIAAPMCITDKKNTCIYVSKEKQVFNASALVTSNECMINIAQCYFDSLWKQAKKVKILEQ